MLSDAMPGAYLAFAVLFGAAPRTFRRVGWRPLAMGACSSAAVLAAGAAAGLHLFPWTDLPVTIFALSAGTLLGRAVRPRPLPMAVVLAVLSGLDSIQLLAASGAPGGGSSASFYYGMLVISTPWHRTAIGVADLLLITAMSEHWQRRGAHFPLALAGGLLGLALADGFAALVYQGGLPLVPFLFAGWLLAEAWHDMRPWLRARVGDPVDGPAPR